MLSLLLSPTLKEQLRLCRLDNDSLFETYLNELRLRNLSPIYIKKVWGYDYGGTARTVDVHIRSLRRKIEDNPVKPEHLLTVHGFGYKFEG